MSCTDPSHLPLVTCQHGSRTNVIRFGFFPSRKGERVQRYRCKRCSKTFSDATFSLLHRLRKPEINAPVVHHLASGASQNRLALIYNVNRKTIVRRFLLFGKAAAWTLEAWRAKKKKVEHMQFDDVETSVHTKCKPVSITLAVDGNTREILDFEVSSMPAKGRLAKIAFARYGPRADDRAQARADLFTRLQNVVSPYAEIRSDQNPHYTADVKKYFPDAIHTTTKGRRGCVTGQGELKATGHDPLFALNHTAAMLRANINRLFRRTWCTTKRMDRLALHLSIYAVYHNFFLLKQ